MPNRFRSYSVPTPPPTGDPTIDDALGKWAAMLSQHQQDNMLDQERLPYTMSAVSTANVTLTGAPQSVVGTTVQLMGSESLIIHGALTITNVNLSSGKAYLKVVYPGGTSRRLTDQSIKLTRNGIVSRSWPLQPEFQSGGKLKLDIICSASDTAVVTDASIIVDAR